MEFFSGLIVGVLLSFGAYKIKQRRDEKPRTSGGGGGGGRPGGGGNIHAE